MGQQRVAIPATPFALQNGSAQFIAHYAPERMLRLTIALKPPHMVEEEQFLRELQDPQSPKFHQFLSEPEWNARFAPSAADEQAVAAWAQSQGLTITQRFANRLLVDVEAPAGVIERAFNVTINSYRVGEHTCFSNDRDPSIPTEFSGVVQTVLGLNSIEVPHRMSARKGAAPEPQAPDYLPGPAYVIGPASRGDGDRRKLAEAMAQAQQRAGGFSQSNPYGPADMYGSWAYDYAALQNLGHCCNPLHNPGGSPPETSIAIVIWYDITDSDLQGFLTWYPYLAHNIQRYFIDGGPYTGGDETTLDVEWTIATANSFGSSADTATIHVYEGGGYRFNVLLDVANRSLSDNHARVLTMSWGAAEIWEEPRTTIDSFHAVFNQFIGEGWTIFAASGDQGAEADCRNVSVSYPGSDPDITSSGGTSLNLFYDTYQGEFGWQPGPYGCQYNDGGSGGGCSAVFAAPWYQGNTACGAGSRSLPDIALNADWYYTPQAWFYQGIMDYNGGTSIVAPELAGFAAQENAYLLYLQSIIGNTCGPSASAPCAPMGSANPYLYFEGLYQPFAAHYPFYDIVQGCIGFDFCAGPGFDQVTGWGSANMLQLAWSVNNYLAGDFGSPVVSFTGPPANHWYNSDQTVSWNITDTSINGHRPNGVAGFSGFWDTDPGDVYTEATPGYGNSFYNGPQYANGTSGSLDLVSAGLGCHTANVRAWDNAGQPTPDETYGPVCFDNTPPVTTVALSGHMNGQYYQPQVTVTLTAYDDLSGIAATYYRIDSGNWQTYSAPLVITAIGPHTFGFYSTDAAGNSDAQQSINFWVISLTRNTLTVSKVGSGTGNVTSSDGDINCGATCNYLYYDGLPVTLNPAPNPGSVFAGWSGCDSTSGYSCALMVLSDRTATVTFNQAVPLQFVAVDPCRVVDTRLADGQFGGPPIQGHTSRSFPIPQGPCPAIPSTAAAYALNVTVVPHEPLNFLTVWPTGQSQPVVSTLNSYDGRTKAAAAIVPAGDSQAVSVYVTDTTDVILDINGYFVAPDSSTLAYFALPDPCRVIDTRGPQGPLGGPFLSGGQERDFPVLSSSNCNIPSSAQAYSFNVTAVPHRGLGFLTLWPFGQSRPTVSTLNAPTGTVTANAAIVKPGNQGELAAYATQDTDLIVDINGYFAATNSGQNPLSLYALIPCRALDTRPGAFSSTITVPMTTSPCALTSSAHAYVLNATVVPQGFLDYLTLWPTGQNKPLASTLNSYDGAVTSNMAIVLGGSGSVNAYASDWTQLILDISSYFGP